MDLAGATVLLTGASSGIGAALAPMLAAHGATVAITGRRADKLDEVLARCRSHVGACEAFVVDLGDRAAVEALPAEVEAAVGPVDVLVNNAGTPKRRAVQEMGFDDVTTTMAVNFEAPVLLTLALLPGMLARDRGCIVNVSSFGGRAGIPAETAYCASKFALCGWTEAMAIDLWHTGVDVRLVLPGAIDTDIWDRPGSDRAHYQGQLEPPGTVADAIVAAIEGEAFEVYAPDLRPVAEFKTSSIDDYLAGARAMADDAEG